MRKYFLTKLFLFTLSITSYADCDSGGLLFWPAGGVLNPKTNIVITAYGTAQNIVLGLNKKYRVYLKAGDQKVFLRVKETHTGQYYLAQAILEPVAKLQINVEYELCIDSLNGYEKLLVKGWDKHTSERVPIKWLVQKKNDTLYNSIRINAPIENRKVFEYLGCGEDVFVIFKYKMEEDFQHLIKARVKNRNTGKETIFYLQTDGTEIKVGHDMCSGAFVFDDGKEFEVYFSILDFNGRVRPMNKKGIRFTAPEEFK